MDVFLRITLKFWCFLEWIYFLLVDAFYGGQEKKCVLASSDHLLNTSATVLAGKIRTGQVTSEKLVKAYVSRIKEVNQVINAVVEERFQDALEDAKRADDFVAKQRANAKELEVRKPLLGVPITVKECIAVKGLSYTGCSKTRQGIKADEDGDVVRLLKEAGAIPLLVSNTPEYCTSYESSNKITGTTVNPYNTMYTSGGSSGGEGALLGAGASLIGIGSDILGSIRVPCAFNGIFGHKPTSGVVSLRGHFPLSSAKKFADYLVIGPLARYAEDLKLSLKVMAGENAVKLDLDKEIDFRSVKVFFMEEAASGFCLPDVDKAIKIAIKEAVMYLSRQSHCVVTDRKFAEFGNSLEMMNATVLSMDDQPSPFSDSKGKYSLCAELVKSLVGKTIFSTQLLLFMIMTGVNTSLFGKSQKDADEAEKLRAILIDELKDNGVLLFPTYPTAALRHGAHFTGLSGSMYPGIFNALELPATCVPVGLNDDGMPIGIQVVAAPYQDRLCLAIAQELEKCFLGWQPLSDV